MKKVNRTLRKGAPLLKRFHTFMDTADAFLEKHYSVGWFFAALGIFTLLFVVISLFTSLTENIHEPSISSSLPLTDPAAFEATLAHAINAPIEKSSPVTILTNGQEFLPDLLEEIHGAQKSIYITDYIWDDGEFGTTLFKALTIKAKEGVRVRILLDGISGRGASKEGIKKLTDAGGKVEQFRPVSVWSINRINGRTHVRDFVIDDRTAYLGGIAVSDGWLGNATTSVSWHDFMFKVHEAMATRSSNVFANMWNQSTGEILIPTSPPIVAPVITGGTSFVSLLSVPGNDFSSNIETVRWLSIQAATKSIHIVNPYLILSKPEEEILKKKAQEGVDVEIILPGKNIDSKYTRWASQSFYTELLAAGVKIYEYQPSRIHAKVMTIDGVWSVVGSANFDNRSSRINLEYVMGIMDPAFATDLEKKFQEDKGKSSEIKKDEWKTQSILLIPFQRLARLFVHEF